MTDLGLWNLEVVIESLKIVCFATTSSKGTVKIRANGTEALEVKRELFVFEKVEGLWKIARYMFNKTEPKQ